MGQGFRFKCMNEVPRHKPVTHRCIRRESAALATNRAAKRLSLPPDLEPFRIHPNWSCDRQDCLDQVRVQEFWLVFLTSVLQKYWATE